MFLINEISKFARVFKKEKLIEINDELFNSLSEIQLNYINELKAYKYILQYYIE